MKRIGVLLFMLPMLLSAQCIKGTVTDAQTGESIPFVPINVLQDGDIVMRGTSDFDGVYTIRLSQPGRYELTTGFYNGYRFLEKTEVDVHPQGFTVFNFSLYPTGTSNGQAVEIDGIPIIEIGIPDSNVATRVSYRNNDTATILLPEYKVVDAGLRRMLDRVVEGMENTYDADPETYGFERGSLPEGTTCDLRMTSLPKIDSSRNAYGSYNEYLYYLYSASHLLPQALGVDAPDFQLDKPSVKVDVNITHRKGEACEAWGYIEYRGVIFFLNSKVEEHLFIEPADGKRRFKNGGARYVGIWDPPTWIYSFAEGYWYRWIEFPVGW